MTQVNGWTNGYVNSFTGLCRFILLNDQTFQTQFKNSSALNSILSLTCLNDCSSNGICGNGNFIFF